MAQQTLSTDKLKAYYLLGLVHSGFQQAQLQGFLDGDKGGELGRWTIEELLDAGQEFVRKNRTDREEESARRLEKLETHLRELEKASKEKEEEAKRNWKSGFMEGVFGLGGVGYSDFCRFLSAKAAAPIDNLSLDDIKAQLGAYRASKRPKLAFHKLPRLQIVPPLPPAPESAPSSPSPLRSSIPDAVSDTDLTGQTYLLPAIQTPITHLSTETDVFIEVSSPQVTKGFLFMPDSYTYTVTTKNFNWVVNRTQQDFEWLRNTLKTAFPGYIVPPTPSVKGGLDHQRFLEAVLAGDVFRGSGALRAFLREENLENAKNTRIKHAERAEDMWTVTGYITCDPDESSDHIVWQHEYFYHDQAAKIKLAENLATTKFHLKEAADSLKFSSKQLQIVENLQNTMQGCLSYRGIYAALSDLVDFWAETQSFFGSMLIRHLTAFFHAQIEELTSIKDLVSDRKHWLEAYQSHPTDSHFKNLYGYFNYQSKAEVDRVIKYQCKCLAANFAEMSEGMLGKLEELEEKWRGFWQTLKTKGS
jgi:hypothetical protein